MMKTWEEMTKHEQLAATHYDMYKDVHGVRPRWYKYDAMSEQDLLTELDHLEREMVAQIEREKVVQKEAAEKFEQRVAETIGHGAKDRETAIRWMMDAAGCDNDVQHFCYVNNLPYNYFN